jgi:GTP-binding protein Era
MTTSPTAIEEALHRVRRTFEMTPKVAIAGFGNAGKSSLFNAIYGAAKASVSMRTDHTTEAQTETRFGIAFTDTPGIGTSAFSLAKVAQMAVFDRQHIVIHVLNGTTAISNEDEALHELIEKSSARRVTVVNKADLLDAHERREFAASVADKLGLFEGNFLFVSAKRGLNVDQLVRHIVDILPEAMQDAFIGQQRADIQLKEKRVRALVYSKATVCAGFAVTPFPIADFAVITPIQITMVATIGYLHGIPVTKERALELLGILGAGFGLREVARQLVKLVPGAGSVVSAGVAFAGTVALGETANLWFKHQMKVPPDELRKVFSDTAAKARKDYDARAGAPEVP